MSNQTETKTAEQLMFDSSRERLIRNLRQAESVLHGELEKLRADIELIENWDQWDTNNVVLLDGLISEIQKRTMQIPSRMGVSYLTQDYGSLVRASRNLHG